MPDDIVQIASDDANDFSARCENCVGDCTHEPDSGTPVDKSDVSLCEFIAKGMCGVPVGGVFAFTGTAIDADSLHATRLRQDGTAQFRHRCNR